MPGNVRRNIHLYQPSPNFPLCSYGLRARSSGNVEIENLDVTNQRFKNKPVTHGNIENFMVPDVIEWIKKEACEKIIFNRYYFTGNLNFLDY
ncbi:hypothetical protein QTN47_08790 [Danxiaibacter flavus]|uniref:Uncharacterized protein n=1 Tax=Danxiaibacter flavus TaxID=3049108 RepID=A0ABV3ZDL9_9BACT|nr:hypothetical protein QNM32_08790 [Chitinophagaceae bacterium DXS]